MTYTVKANEMTLTEEEKAEGWKITCCWGNAYADPCWNLYKVLNWYTPSCCPHCHASRID